MARHADVLFVAALALAAASPAQAADRQSISIAPGRLGEAVIALARQTGVSIGMSDQSLANLPTRGLRGRLSVPSALKRLLRGSGAHAQRIDDTTWRIVRDRPQRRSPPLPKGTPPLPPRQEPPPVIIIGNMRAMLVAPSSTA